MASGKEEYLPLVRKEAHWAADFSADSFQTWYYGYVMMLLSEYVMATGDESVMPGLRRLALEAANGQSIVGSWGHGFARPDGRLGGYGMMNSPGLPLTISLILAREAGVDDPKWTRRSNGARGSSASTSARGPCPTAITTLGSRPTRTTASAEWQRSCSTCWARRRERSSFRG